ncbi:MAG: hypothetical protein AAB451_02590 [Patescibacteria group bacterium]
MELLVKERKLNTLIRRTIIETVQDVLLDPDLGLELQGWVKKRLKEHPQKFIPLEEIKKKYRP